MKFSKFGKNDICWHKSWCKKQQELKELVAVSCNFLKEQPSKLEIQCKTSMHFSFDFDWCSIQLDIVCRGQGVGVLLGEKNLLSQVKPPSPVPYRHDLSWLLSIITYCLICLNKFVSLQLHCSISWALKVLISPKIHQSLIFW